MQFPTCRLATAKGDSTAGLEILTEDMNVAQEEAGLMHYITDGGVVLVNDFVIKHENKDDTNLIWIKSGISIK